MTKPAKVTRLPVKPGVGLGGTRLKDAEPTENSISDDYDASGYSRHRACRDNEDAADAHRHEGLVAEFRNRLNKP